MTALETLDPATDRLTRDAYLLGAVPALVLGIVGAIVHPLLGAVMLVVAAGGWAVAVRLRLQGAVDRLVAPLGAVELRRGDRPRLENVLEGLCVTGGVHEPKVLLVDADQMNAMVAADRETATIVITTGLVDGLGLVQLEGVVANLLGRIKDGSARYGTTVIALLGVSAAATRRLSAGLGEQRAVHSDLAAVDLTRYPPGLMGALREMAAAGTSMPQAPPTTQHLWVAPPGATHADGELDESTMQPLEVRIAVLEQL